VLLLDEPLSNLDAKLRDEMRVELTELQRKLGVTFVYVTHDQAEALSDVRSRRGASRPDRSIRSGPPQEIFVRPASIHVAAFIGQGNLLGGVAGERRDGRLGVRLDDGSMVQSPAPSSIDSGTRVRLLIRRNGATVHRSIEAARRESSSVLAGHVRAVLYQGMLVDLHVELAGGTRCVSNGRHTKAYASQSATKYF
jgi:ABC-type Fe3+/spermidine/putrescine transport system ATPase subunit